MIIRTASVALEVATVLVTPMFGSSFVILTLTLLEEDALSNPLILV